MKSTRIKIRTNIWQRNSLLQTIESAINQINAPLREALEAIGITPTEELIKGCFESGQKIADIYQENLQKDLQVMKVPASRVLFEESSKKAFKTFEDFRRDFTEKYNKSLLKYISFDKDFAFLSDESKNQIDEDCSVFVEKPEEIEAYNQHLKACEALNDLFQGHKSQAWPQFFELDENGKFIPAELVNYDVLVTNIKKAKENG